MTDDSTATTSVSAAASFMSGAGQGLVIAGFVMVCVYMANRESYPERLEGVEAALIGVVLASGVVGGMRAMLLGRHTHWLPRILIGGLLGAVLGSLIGWGFMHVMIPRGEPTDLQMILWCAGCFGLILALRPLSHRH